MLRNRREQQEEDNAATGPAPGRSEVGPGPTGRGPGRPAELSGTREDLASDLAPGISCGTEADTSTQDDHTLSQVAALEAQVIAALRSCYDPEIPVSIYDLGLIYEVRVEPTSQVYIRMTLTSPACPVAGALLGEVEWMIRQIPGVQDVQVELTWDPMWNPGMMSEAARLQLGIY